KLNFFEHLQEETLEGVLAVTFFDLGLFFILAAFSKAGIVGDRVFEFFRFLFGIGYYLLPVLLFALCWSYFRAIKKTFVGAQSIGALIFFLSALGLISL